MSYVTPTHNYLKDYALADQLLSETNLDDAINQIKQDIVELSSKQVLHYFNSISFLKAYAEEPTNINIQFYSSRELSSVISVGGNPVVFDSADAFDRGYIEGLLINNIDNSGQQSQGGLYGAGQGTQWKPPLDNKGFGTEYNNAPVVLRFVDWAEQRFPSWVGTFGRGTRLYIKYFWYFNDIDGEIHKSDDYSQVVPAQAEQSSSRLSMGAASSRSALKWNNAYWSDSIDGFERDAYELLPQSVNYLVDGLDGNNYDVLYLRDYDLANEYRIKFTASSSFTLGNDGGDVLIFSEDGRVSDFESTSIEFEGGKTYLVSIQAGMVSILATA